MDIQVKSWPLGIFKIIKTPHLSASALPISKAVPKSMPALDFITKSFFRDYYGKRGKSEFDLRNDPEGLGSSSAAAR